MGEYSVTLKIGGDISVADFAERVDLWAKVLSSLSNEAGQPVEWALSDLGHSSAIMTADPVPETEEAEAFVPRLVEDYLAAALDVYEGRADQSRPTPRLISRLVEKATPDADITFETPADEVIFEGAPEVLELTERPSAPPATLGTLSGRIETLSQRRGLRFTLYDLLTDRAVSCYVEPGQEELLRNVWGRLAAVTGLIKRNPRTDRPVSVRRVSAIEAVPDPGARAWASARGAVVPAPDSPPSEVLIRRLRDAG